jgi:hypothetical protein
VLYASSTPGRGIARVAATALTAAALASTALRWKLCVGSPVAPCTTNAWGQLSVIAAHYPRRLFASDPRHPCRDYSTAAGAAVAARTHRIGLMKTCSCWNRSIQTVQLGVAAAGTSLASE